MLASALMAVSLLLIAGVNCGAIQQSSPVLGYILLQFFSNIDLLYRFYLYFNLFFSDQSDVNVCHHCIIVI